MGRITDLLNAITSHDEASIQQLYEVFSSINDIEIPIVRHIIFPGSSLIRQRINRKERNFTHVSELSYPPVSIAQIERANLPGHPMFYACSFPSKVTIDAPIPRVIALEETSSFMKDKTKSGIERATVSRWLVKETIELIALPYTGTYDKACPDLLQIKDAWEDAITKGHVPENPLELVHYMAEEISKDFDDREKYFKIANFVNYLLTINTKTRGADGIIYPSVPAQGAGFNVAIKPDVVDAKIQFLNASVCHLLKKEMIMAVIPMSDAVVDEYGNMVFKDRVLTEKERAFYDDNSAGLCFIN